MHRNISIVAVTANKVAMNLVGVERDHNLESIQQQGSLTYFANAFDRGGEEGEKKDHHLVSPVQLALQMTQLGSFLLMQLSISRKKLEPRASWPRRI